MVKYSNGGIMLYSPEGLNHFAICPNAYRFRKAEGAPPQPLIDATGGAVQK